MEKKIYITPNTTILTIVTERLVAASLPKGEGDFDPEEMKYTKENNSDWGDIWDE